MSLWGAILTQMTSKRKDIERGKRRFSAEPPQCPLRSPFIGKEKAEAYLKGEAGGPVKGTSSPTHTSAPGLV